MSVNAGSEKSVLIWDLPVRLVHWLLVICFIGAYLTSEDEGLSLLHVTLGYTMVFLMTLRIIWGFIGSKYARFSNFVKGPNAVMTYFESLVQKVPEHHTGHNPAGALAIIGLLLLGLLVGFSGFAALHEIWGEWGEEVHEAIANVMLILVIVHVIAVVASGWLHDESLIMSMINGAKKVDSSYAITNAHRKLAVVVLLGVLSFWAYQYVHADVGGIDGLSSSAEQEKDHQENDDD